MDFSKVCVFSLAIFFVSAASAALVPQKITVPPSISNELKSFEPSAVVYNPFANSFMVASDDTNEDDEPLFFVIERDGTVKSPALPLEGIDKMTDIESMTIDSMGEFHAMSSLGLNKKGKEKKERNLYVRGEIRADRVVMKDVVELRPLILKAVKKSSDPVIKKISSAVVQELDVESHYVDQGQNLFIGLKNPQPAPGVALIISLGQTDDVFAKKVQARVFKALDFKSVSGEDDLLSDIAVRGDKLVLTTTQEKGTGRLWVFDPATDGLTLLQEFDRLKPEGLAFKDAEAMIVFDQGNDEAQFAFGKF